MGQILVKVRNKSTDDDGKPTVSNGVETVITYKAYTLTADKYDLIYQCDQNGKQVFGNTGQPNPNLEAQHKAVAQQRNAAPVVNSGPTEREQDLARQLAEAKAMLAKQSAPPVQSDNTETEKITTPPPAPQAQTHKRKPGPKPRLTEQVA